MDMMACSGKTAPSIARIPAAFEELASRPFGLVIVILGGKKTVS
jgi:hypothetical protein